MIDQYFTPAWAAHELWDAFADGIELGSVVVEPTCGDGRMLQAIPAAFRAFGVEEDPLPAAVARVRTGREVVVGSIFEVALPDGIAAAFGNPPFKAVFLDRMLMRLASAMHDGGKCGFILPAYLMQTDNRVLRWNQTWTMSCDLLPRTIFPRLMKPIVFATFVKDPNPVLRGMRLFYESDIVRSMRAHPLAEMQAVGGRWRAVVEWALRTLGGEAHLTEIYETVFRKRPTSNQWWQAKVRQVLQINPGFVARGAGVWALAAAA